MGQATTWTGVFFYHCSDELMYSRASALLLLLLKLVVSVLEMASNKRKAKKMLKFKENDIAAHCITGREYLVRSIRENKCGQRVVRTDENGDEYILDEVKLTGGVGEEVRIVPVGNKFTLEALCATREKFDKMAELVAQRLSVDENGEFIMRELTTEEFEEIEKALYKEGNRKVIATTLEGD